jgi:putative PIN family toxin of toxin-antitoxin system
MRAVIDTGVFISAAIKMQTTPSLAIHRAVQSGVLLKSGSTEAEFLDVINRPYLARFISPEARAQMMQLMAAAELVTITERITACRDAKDDKFLEVAVNGQADIIITGDADLLVLNPFRDIPIVTPTAFLSGTARR